jgi:hypothetical protein
MAAAHPPKKPLEGIPMTMTSKPPKSSRPVRPSSAPAPSQQQQQRPVPSSTTRQSLSTRNSFLNRYHVKQEMDEKQKRREQLRRKPQSVPMMGAKPPAHGQLPPGVAKLMERKQKQQPVKPVVKQSTKKGLGASFGKVAAHVAADVALGTSRPQIQVSLFK